MLSILFALISAAVADPYPSETIGLAKGRERVTEARDLASKRHPRKARRRARKVIHNDFSMNQTKKRGPASTEGQAKSAPEDQTVYAPEAYEGRAPEK